MKKIQNISTHILALACFFSFISCSQNDKNLDSSREIELIKKENELLKRELSLTEKESQTTKATNDEFKNIRIDELTKSLNKLLQNNRDFIEGYFYSTGDFQIDMGTASDGRIKTNLKLVKLTKELRPEEPGCADICPERYLIHFKCKNGKCIGDPMVENMLFDKGVIVFYDIQKGKEFYKKMMELKGQLD